MKTFQISIKTVLVLIVFAASTNMAFAQKERKHIREGNRHYQKAVADTTKIDSVRFQQAETAYRRALEIKPNDFKPQFNIGAAQFKQNKMQEANTQFEKAVALAQTNDERSHSYFNLGNSLLAQQKFDESIEAYKNALRNNPRDLEAKYNLEFARRMKKQQEEQQKQDQDQNKDQDKDQDKDKDKEQEQDQNQDQNKDQQQNDQQQKQDQQQQKISPQSAEQMLQALDNDEKKTQEKVNKARAVQVKTSRPEKEW